MIHLPSSYSLKKILPAFLLFICMSVRGQWSESFTDGNFTVDPVWTGNASDWLVITNSDVAAGATGSNTLRLNAATGSGMKYLSTQISGSWGLQQTWSFWMGRRAQAATSANVAYVWLYANEADVTTVTVDGYRIRFGDDAGGDELVLELVTNGVG